MDYNVNVIETRRYKVDFLKFAEIYKDDLEAEFGDNDTPLEDNDIRWFIEEIIHTYGHEIHGVEDTDFSDVEYEVEKAR